jgi:glycosyltransferase involved in cell wall biosynthesis
VNVLILTTMTPFHPGEAEKLSQHLVRNLKARDVNAEVMRLPFKGAPHEHLLDEVFIYKTLKIWNVDRVVALNFPSYLVPFDNKVCWILQHDHEVYGSWDAENSSTADSERLRLIRSTIIRNDSEALRGSRLIFAGSQTIQEQLQKYNSLDSKVLIPPLNDPEIFSWEGDDGYILAPGQVNDLNRQELLIEAIRFLPSGTRLLIAGPPDSLEDADKLRRNVAEAGLEDGVKLVLRNIPRQELAHLVGRARAVAALSLDKNSFGHTIMEAFQASKPVVTTTDSVGMRGLVRHGETGRVSEPTAEALADNMATLLSSSGEAADIGRAGHNLWRSLDVNWPTTIDQLLA